MSARRPKKRYWHGGVPGLQIGDLVPANQTGSFTASIMLDPADYDPAMVAVTTDRQFAKAYAGIFMPTPHTRVPDQRTIDHDH